MSRTCTVCRHPKRGEIDQALVGGEPYRSVAKHFEASEQAVWRHKGHVAARMAQAAVVQEAARAEALAREAGQREAKEIVQADGLLASVQRLRERLETALDAANAARDVAALAREARETARLLLEVEGRLRQGTAVQVSVSIESVRTEVAAISARVYVALSDPKFAEARALVLAAMTGEEDAQVVPAPSRALATHGEAAAAIVAAGGRDP